jgi:hypothetical protein
MPTYRRAVSRRVSALLTRSIYGAVMLMVLCAAPDAMSQSAGQNSVTANATGQDDRNPFSRFFRMTPAQPAATAPAETQPQPRIRKPRLSKARKRPKPVAVKSAPAARQPIAPSDTAATAHQTAAESGWPPAADHVGGAMISTLTVKSVREQLEPEPESALVSEHDLSDIDRAARLAHAEAATPDPTTATDGSGAMDNDPAEQTRVIAKNEIIKSWMQTAWLEPVLLMIAGALAGLAAARAFA